MLGGLQPKAVAVDGGYLVNGVRVGFVDMLSLSVMACMEKPCQVLLSRTWSRAMVLTYFH
jgi:hypothetical protein